MRYSLPLVLFASLMLNGCWYCTARISEIGLRGERITATEDGQCQVDRIAITTYDYYGMHLPYSYSMDRYGGRIVDSEKGTWEIKNFDLLITYGDGTGRKIPGGSQNLLRYGFYSEPRRRWWGYPSQLLQVIAIPVDLITGPFVLGYDALFGAKQAGP